jgi:hypothetical protein
MINNIKLKLTFASALAILGCSSEDTSSYPVSGASYGFLDSEIGCDSKYSEDKKEDIFNSQYKNHWMTWSGEVTLPEAGNVALNIDGKGTQDLQVDFADKKAGYDLTEGNVITVKFIMKTAGGCFLPFSGEQAEIVLGSDISSPESVKTTSEEALSALEIKKMEWYKGGFENIMLVNATIKNNGKRNVKDIQLECVHSANSGTKIDSNKQVIYETIPAGKSLSIKKFNMGFINSQAAFTGCNIIDAVVIPNTEYTNSKNKLKPADYVFHQVK